MLEQGSSVALLERPPQDEATPKIELTRNRELMVLVCGLATNEIATLSAAILATSDPAKTGDIYGVRSELERIQGDTKVASGPRLLPPDRIKTYLVPSGIVKMEDAEKNDLEKALYPTEKTRGDALGFEGHMLQFSLDHEPSLYDFFGSTVGSFLKNQVGVLNRNSSPVTRVAFFEMLTDTNSAMNANRLVTAVGRHRSKGTLHFTSLAKRGIITYESTERGKPHIFYGLSDKYFDQDEMPEEHVDKEWPWLSWRVYEAAYNNRFTTDEERLTIESTAEKIMAVDNRYAKTKKEFLMIKIGTIYARLAERGVIERFGFHDGTRSHVSLSDPQMRTLSELLSILRRFHENDRDFIDEGKRKAYAILDDPEKVRKLIEKASRKKRAIDQKTGKNKENAPKETVVYETTTVKWPRVNKRLNPDDLSWKNDGACRDEDVAVFYPDSALPEAYEQAKTICATCPVQKHCLHFALETNQDDGIWGGASEEERRRMKMSMQTDGKSA